MVIVGCWAVDVLLFFEAVESASESASSFLEYLDGLDSILI